MIQTPLQPARLLFFSVLALTACITPEPPRAPKPAVDSTELFRRARFKELSHVSEESFGKVIDRLRPKNMSAGEEMVDYAARSAYRAGDGRSAKEAAGALVPSSRTRATLDALLDNVDLDAPLNACHTVSGVAELPLDETALEAGYAIVSARVGGRAVRLLWDTGATENVLSDGLADDLELPLKKVEFTLNRGDDALVVRFEATGVGMIDLGPLKISNATAIVTELHTVAEHSDTIALDGFLSPQLLLREGCFEIDRRRAMLTVAFTRPTCSALMASVHGKEPIFTWDGEVFVNARVHESPDVSVQLETGSPVTYLRADASRYMPKGLLKASPAEREGEIAHQMSSTVLFSLAGRSKAVSAIDFEPRRPTIGHDDIGTVGTDLLLQGAGFVVSFATMELGFLTDAPYADANALR